MTSILRLIRNHHSLYHRTNISEFLFFINDKLSISYHHLKLQTHSRSLNEIQSTFHALSENVLNSARIYVVCHLLLASARAHAFSISFRFSLIKRKSFWLCEQKMFSLEAKAHETTSIELNSGNNSRIFLDWRHERSYTTPTHPSAPPPNATTKSGSINRPRSVFSNRELSCACMCAKFPPSIDVNFSVSFEKPVFCLCSVTPERDAVGGMSRWGTKIHSYVGEGRTPKLANTNATSIKARKSAFWVSIGFWMLAAQLELHLSRKKNWIKKEIKQRVKKY